MPVGCRLEGVPRVGDPGLKAIEKFGSAAHSLCAECLRPGVVQIQLIAIDRERDPARHAGHRVAR